MSVVKRILKNYSSSDLAIIIPTRNRPDSLLKLLNSLEMQKLEYNEIIIISSGNDVSEITSMFKNNLPIKHIHTDKGGQIYQRNIGIAALSDSTRLIGSLDDDLVIGKDSIKRMIDYWNSREDNVGGIGFNIVNAKKFKINKLFIFLKLSSDKPGQVLKSGINTSVLNVSNNIDTQWLLGGAAVWKKEILLNYKHTEIKGNWAVGEDVIYSYPLSKIYKLEICADARVRHEHKNDQFDKAKVFYNKGRTFTLWKLYFITKNKELSKLQFCYNFGVRALGQIVRGILKKDRTESEFGFGMLIGIVIGFYKLITGKDII